MGRADASVLAPVLLEGRGWRVGWMPERTPFCALLGGDDWAFELTEAEWRDFCRSVRSLAEALRASSTELMDEETLTLEQETETLLLVSTGYITQRELYVQLRSGRLAEGSWSAEATSDFADAVMRLGMKSGVL